MKFEYEISVDDYVASQMLYRKLAMGRKRFRRSAFWLVAGTLFILTAWRQDDLNWAPVLLAVTGAWWLYVGLYSLFPGPHFRRSYRGAGLAGKKFQADIAEEGFEVAGDLCTWKVRWAGVSVKGEDEHGFMLYVAGTVFMFGKKHFTDAQQCEFRRFAALSPVERS